MVDLYSMTTPNLLGDAEARTIGERFVRQYYRKLQETPHLLHRQYQNMARLSHISHISEESGIYVSGQLAIKMFFKELHLNTCIAKIAQVDSHATLGRGVVVQVCGKLSTNGQPMRCFMQTFVLARKYAMNYFVVNDIFRYPNEVFDDESGPEEEEAEETTEEKVSENGGEDEPVNIQSVEEKQSGQEGEPVNNGTEQEQEVEVPTPAEPETAEPAAHPSWVDVVRGETISEGADQSAPFLVPASRHPVKPSRPAEPETVDPEAAERVTVEPETAERDTVERVTVDPKAAEQDTVEPEAAERDTVERVTVDPEAAERVTVEPEAAEQVTVEPEAAERVTAEPEAAERITVDPEAAERVTVEPEAAERVTVKPEAAERVTVEPEAAERVTVDPEAAERVTVETEAAERVTVDPEAAERVTVDPEAAERVTVDPEAAERVTVEREIAEPETAEPAAHRSWAEVARGTTTSEGASQSSLFVPASRRHVKPSRPAEEKPASKRKANPSLRGDSFAGRLGRSPGSRHPDSHQVFVGNIPHHISESDLKAFFQRWGNVVGVKINTKNKDSKLPYFGFVAFESATPVQNVLKEKPVRFDGGHRLNVEEKATRSGGSRGGGPRSGISGQGGRGHPYDGYRRGRGGNTRW